MLHSIINLIGGLRVNLLRKTPVGVALSLASFALYATIALFLPQLQDSAYRVERDSIAAAVTNMVFGARPGVADSELLGIYRKSVDASLQKVLDQTKAAAPDMRAAGPKPRISAIRDGNGVGYLVFATIAFRLLGLHSWALPLLMIAFMGCSAAAFIARFGHNFANVVILYFSALTLMLFLPVVWDTELAEQIPIGGIRYFSLTAVLPAFHILLELWDVRARRQQARWEQVCLASQSVILVLACLVRGNAVVLVGIIALIVAVLGWQSRHDRERLRGLRRKAVICGVVALGVVGVIAATLPFNYLAEGRFGTVIWHRVNASLGVNPAFPYPGLADMFECKEEIPEGILPGVLDRNGHCMFHDYLIRHKIIAYPDTAIYGRLYETAMRDAFFRILNRYPVEVLTTFLYYKPLSILHSLAYDLALLAPSGAVTPYLPIASGLFLAMIAVTAYFAPIPPANLRQTSTVALVSAAWTIPPYFVAWAAPHTSIDLLFYFLFLVGLGLAAIPVGMRALMWRPQPETPYR